MIMINDGYQEPFDVEIIPHPKPTERQLGYAKDLGIKLPKEATSEDLSALISRVTDHDDEPNEGLMKYATNKGFCFSKYIGKKSLYDLIFNKLDLKDRIAFFIFSIYRYLSDDRHANLDTSVHKEKFYSFAEKKVNDNSFLKSIRFYSGADLRYFGTFRVGDYEIEGASTNTISYKTSVSYLKEIGLIDHNAFTTVKSVGDKNEFKVSSKKKNGIFSKLIEAIKK